MTRFRSVSGDAVVKRPAGLLAIAFLLVSALYFADTLLRASLKTFWYDELVTVLLCRLPGIGDIYAAVMHGADFNPPLLYLFTYGSQHLFGEGLIASRLPAILGFWCFAACLFFFVRRRLGSLAGAIAALFPIFTLAHWYAYEARAYGIVLAWTGIMLVAWQRARERGTVSLWLVAFWLGWLGALLTHVYAVYLLVPFLAVECLGLLRTWRPHPGIIAALLVAPVCVAPLYLRMMHAYRGATALGGIHIHPYEVAQDYVVSVVAPGLVLLLLLLLLLAFDSGREAQPQTATPPRLLPQELALAVALACLPLVGILGARLSHGPYFHRYFLAAVAGLALLFAQAAAAHSRPRAVRALAAAMLFLLVADTGIAAYCRWRHADLDQVEPVSHFPFPPSPARPLERFAALLRNHSTQDIAIPDEHRYLYLYYYAPPELRRRLVLTLPGNTAFSLSAYQQQARFAHLGDERISTLADFLHTGQDFYLYDPVDARSGACPGCLQPILDAGFHLRSVDQDTDQLLEHFTR